MPRRWRWLVPMTALMACALPRAGAGAAPLPLTDNQAARDAKISTVRALVQRKARFRERVRARAARADELEGVVRTAVAQIGDGYAWGGTGPDGFDCSGLTAFAFARAGVALPHNSQAQAAVGRPVSRRDIRRGDLVFFSTAGPGASHVGIAMSASTVVSATNAGVMEHAIGDAYWGGHYVGARRVL